MKKILSAILCAALLAATLAFTASAQTSYQPEVGDNYISFDFNQITGGIVNNVPNATVNKNVSVEGVSAVEFVPTPNAEGAKGNFTLDCFRLAGYSAKVTVPDYKYVGVTYYYKTEKPCYEGPLYFNILPNSNKAFSGSALSTQDLVTNQWAEAIFDFSETMKLSSSVAKDDDGNPMNWLQQAHFRPFNSTSATDVPETDRFYVAKYTFYKKNPDPNAKAAVRFEKGTPEATGEMANIEVKEGEKYTLPAATFTYPNAEFLGWKTGESETVIPAGTEVTCDGLSKTYTAAWKVEKQLDAVISLDFTEYEDGIVNHTNAGIVEHVERDGRNVVAIQPNPAYPIEKGKNLTVDGYSYKKAGIDLDYYKYCAVEYYYDSKNPIKDTRMYAAIMKNGNVLKNAVSAESDNTIVSGNWVIALFDFSEGIAAQYNGETEDHVMRQMHLRPLGSNNLQTLSVDDRVYISRIMFFQEKPDFQTHEAYMNGYTDGTFKPSGTMTRAEACTVVARLLEKEENIAGTSTFTDVPADQWFAKYIGYCQSKGLLNSYSGTFAPNQPITRAEFSELVYLTGLAKATDKTVAFTDVDASHAKYASIMAAASAGLINGYDNGNGTYSFKPDATITRAEVVTIINRARGRDMKQENLTSDMLLVALDVDVTHWAFANIAEAAVPHVEWNGTWLYPSKDPIVALGEKLDLSSVYKIDEGNAKVAELDALEAQRIAEIRSTPNMDITKFGDKVVYVSASSGDDNNDGKTPATAVKTLAKANSLVSRNGAVLLKRGDMWRERMTAKTDVTYSAYGDGAKPILNGSPENGANPESWALVHKDDATGALIWQYKNADMTDVGTLVLNNEGYALKELPTYIGGKFVVRGNTAKEFDWKVELDRDLEFFHAADSKLSGQVPDAGSAKGPLYFRCDSGNPGKVFDSIEFNMKGNGISIGGPGVTVDNICIMHMGSHGIGSGTTQRLTVTNCEIAWIGGSIQSYNANGNTNNSATRFGNGVEIYGGCDGYKVDNCYIWQNYDAGVTHQYSSRSSGNCTMNNITYSNNVITDTVYSIEYFLGNPNDGGTYVRNGKNHLTEGNLMRRAGYGFGSTRPDGNGQTHIKGWTSRNEFENYVIRNNVFDRCVAYLINPYSEFDATSPKMEGNTYIQGINNKLFHYGKGHTGNADLSAHNAIKNVLGDATGKMYFVETIPYWQFTYKAPKKVEVTADDTKEWGGKVEASNAATNAPTTTPEGKKEVTANAGESTEVVAPLLLRTATDEKNKLYADVRASMNVEVKKDSDGTNYAHITFNNTTNTVLFDCHGLPKYSLESGAVYYKALVRTNVTGKTPHITVYNMADKDGNKVGNGVSGTAPEALKGNGEWEEILIKVTDFPDGAATSTQIHFFLFGNTKGENLFKDGKLIVDGAYLDVAAWAAFPNLASAKAFDLAAASK